MNPDWYHDRDLTTDQADYLQGLQDLRTTDPAIWALLCGVQTSRSIAKLICWPHDWVMIELRRLKEQGLIYDTEGKRSILWHFSPDETEHLDYQRWILQQKVTGGLFNPPTTNENEG